jgi:hypothetical protein
MVAANGAREVPFTTGIAFAATDSRRCRISVMYIYRADVLQHLLRHGVRPTEHTPPELVRDFVRDLYKYEIRALRERYVRGEFPKREYWGRVDALRRRYPVLSLKASEFLYNPNV